uniref:Uncharacterized protein n=1 Tax=Anguilla anguilla TaxID=7936 RepID=A0A0E9X9U7_ANGAN
MRPINVPQRSSVSE